MDKILVPMTLSTFKEFIKDSIAVGAFYDDNRIFTGALKPNKFIPRNDGLIPDGDTELCETYCEASLANFADSEHFVYCYCGGSDTCTRGMYATLNNIPSSDIDTMLSGIGEASEAVDKVIEETWNTHYDSHDTVCVEVNIEYFYLPLIHAILRGNLNISEDYKTYFIGLYKDMTNETLTYKNVMDLRA